MEHSFLSALHAHKVSGMAAASKSGGGCLGLFKGVIWIQLQESRSVESLFGHGSDPLYYMQGEEAVMEYLTGADAAQTLQGSYLYVGQPSAFFCFVLFYYLDTQLN